MVWRTKYLPPTYPSQLTCTVQYLGEVHFFYFWLSLWGDRCELFTLGQKWWARAGGRGRKSCPFHPLLLDKDNLLFGGWYVALGPLRGIDLFIPGRNAHYSFFNRLSCSGRQLLWLWNNALVWFRYWLLWREGVLFWLSGYTGEFRSRSHDEWKKRA